MGPTPTARLRRGVSAGKEVLVFVTLRPRHPAGGFQCEPQANPSEVLCGGRGTFQAGLPVDENDAALPGSGSQDQVLRSSRFNSDFRLMTLLKASC